MSLAEFYLENGNHIKLYHEADVTNMIEEYEKAEANKHSFFIGNWGEKVKELYYNGKLLSDTDFNFMPSKVDLYKFND